MNTRAMLIAAHPDDAEIGMGGTIAALISQGHEIIVVDLTNGEPTPYGSPEIRKKETADSSAILGIKIRIMLDIPNREIHDSIENRKKVANLIREHKPEILFIPYWDDAHPDHLAAHSLCTAARFYSKFSKSDLKHEPHYPRKVLHYFSLHHRAKIEPSFIFDISAHFEKKMRAVKCYKSQFEMNPNNLGALKLFETENAYWGTQIGVAYGEPFVCKEQIKISDIVSLLNI
jgi:bacillithiol biosynthesis deacetylase BshB1